MGKKGQKTYRKKGEFFFNFKQLRRRLNSKQKEKLINFFSNFRTMFLTVKEHLFQVNKMYDLMEQEYKRFQKDLFKNEEYLSRPNQNNENENNNNSEKGEEEFLLDDDIMKQILDEGLKDEKEKMQKEENINLKDSNNNKNVLEQNNNELGKDFFEKDKENDEKKEGGEREVEKNVNTQFSQEFFEWRKNNI